LCVWLRACMACAKKWSPDASLNWIQITEPQRERERKNHRYWLHPYTLNIWHWQRVNMLSQRCVCPRHLGDGWKVDKYTRPPYAPEYLQSTPLDCVQECPRCSQKLFKALLHPWRIEHRIWNIPTKSD
jgi:hypothetical protein